MRKGRGSLHQAANGIPHPPRQEGPREEGPDGTERTTRRADILRCAEMLFARKGYHAVSIRDIAAAASVPIALIRYYFGRKEELFGTIFETHRRYIDERCAAMRQVRGRAGPARAADVIRAWTEPVLRERAGSVGESFSIIVARSVWEAGEENRRIVERYYDPLAQTFIDAMCEALPSCDRATIVWNYQFALGALLMFIADNRVERLSGGTQTAADPSRGEQLTTFIIAGFTLAAQTPGRTVHLADAP